MKPLLVASFALNIVLAGAVGYAVFAPGAAKPGTDSPTVASLPETLVAERGALSTEVRPSAVVSADAAVVPSPPADSALPGDPLPSPKSPPKIFNSSSSVQTPEERSPASAAAPLATNVTVPAEETQVVDPAAPGNSLSYRGVRVAVAESYSSDGSGTALAVDVSSPAETAGDLVPDTSGDFADGSSTRIALAARSGQPEAKDRSPSQPATRVSAAPSDNGDFTREDELFRMKWGWDAFDAVRREAALEAQRKAIAAKRGES